MTRSVVHTFLTVFALTFFCIRRLRNACTYSESTSPTASLPNAGMSKLLMWPFIVAPVDAFLWTKTSCLQRSVKTENGVAAFPIVRDFTASGW